MLKVTNTLLKEEAERRDWKVEVISDFSSLLRYTLPNGKTILLKSVLSPYISALAVELVKDKYAAYKLALEAGVPVAETHIITHLADALKLLQKYGTVVIKPLDSAHGNGVTTHITSEKQLVQAIEAVNKYSPTVLLQPQIEGRDVRLLFIGGEMVASSIRWPARVVGDGVSNLQQLIIKENFNPERGDGYHKKLNFIDMTAAERYLDDRMDEVPAKGETCVVVGTANIGTGGKAEDVTADIPDSLIRACLKLLQAVGFQTGALDFIWSKDGFYFLEINSNPSLGLHAFPSAGQPQPVARLFLDWIEKQLNADEQSAGAK